MQLKLTPRRAMTSSRTKVPDTVSDGLPAAARAKALVAISIAVAMATLDTAITNTALPTIARSISANSASVIWVVTSYQLAMVATLLPAASLGEIVGHRRIYIGGLAIFIVASLGCGIADSLPSLVLARTIQGLGAAGIMSVNTALIRFVYPSNSLGRGMGLNALVVGLAFTAGPTVASIILSVLPWHALFLINVPVGVLSIVLSLRALPVVQARKGTFDIIAGLLCALFFSTIVLGLSAVAHQENWSHALIAWVIAFACGSLLYKRQAKHPAPMLAIDLFRRPLFALSSATSVCAFAAQGLAFVSLPFLFQNVLDRSQVMTGFLMTPWPAAVALMAVVAGRLADRYSPGVLGGIGLLILAFGMLCLAVAPAHPATVDIVWRLLLCGIGFGLFQSPNLKAIMSNVPPSRSGSASGIVAISRLLGQTSGATLVALCFQSSIHKGPFIALFLGAVFALLGSIASALRILSMTLSEREKQNE